MSDKSINVRQRAIVTAMIVGRSYAPSEILGMLVELDFSPSEATLRRDLVALTSENLLLQTGVKKASRYEINHKKLGFLPIDRSEYCKVEIDKRSGNSRYNFELFKNFGDSIFNSQELEHLKNKTLHFLESSIGLSKTLQKREIERFIIELSWKSSKIEGNTYSLLDTERLLKEGIESPDCSKEEALMIVNHKLAFQYILQKVNEYRKINIALISEIHSLLVKDLEITLGLRKRPVGITGSLYRPLDVPSQIEEALDGLCDIVKKMPDPFSKSLLILAGIAYIQPFEDGNKRTSRLTANAILLANDLAPISYRSVDDIAYREAMLVFYERNSIIALKEIFIEQYSFACDNYSKFS